MDASEESAVSNGTTKVKSNNNVMSNDYDDAAAVVDDAPVGKSITHDDDKRMQTIYDKSTSSSSSPSTTVIDEENVKKAISFLRNKEILDVSPSEKRKYLTKVGITQDEIDTALDRLANTIIGDSKEGSNHNSDEGRPPYHRHLQHHQQQNHCGGPHSSGPLPPNYNMQPRHDMNNFASNNMGSIRQEEGESSFFSVSSWAGGFFMSTFCLAALRWLNGGDFVLFPPPVAASMSSVGRIKQNNDTQHDDNHQDGETDYLDEASVNSDGSGDPDLSMILNGTANHERSDVHGNNQEQSSFEDLVMEVKALSKAINSFREEQDRANRVTAAQLGKGVTDDAMDFLRQQKPLVSQKKGDVAAIDKKDISRIRSLIAEMVDELSQVKDSFDDMAVEDGNATVESELDKKTGQTELSSKIDIAIRKGKEVLALVKSPDESSSAKIIESQQAPPAERGNIEKDQDANDTKHEEIEDVDNDKSEPDLTPAANEKSGESSDVNPSSKDLEEALESLSQNNENEALKSGAQMLYLYCKNLSKNPSVPLYRKIYTNNNSFKSKVGNLVGAKEFLSALGFVERTNFFEWSPSNNETSSETKSQLDFALVALELLQKGSQTGDSVHTGSDTSEEKSEKNSD
jgi:hypothetical protein